VLEVAEGVLDGGAGGGQGLVGLALGGGGSVGPGGLVAGDDDRVAGVGVQAGEAEVGEGAEPGGAQPGGDVVAARPTSQSSVASHRLASPRTEKCRKAPLPWKQENRSPCLGTGL
jgi:hypothetical protein